MVKLRMKVRGTDRLKCHKNKGCWKRNERAKLADHQSSDKDVKLAQDLRPRHSSQSDSFGTYGRKVSGVIRKML